MATFARQDCQSWVYCVANWQDLHKPRKCDFSLVTSIII